MKKFELRCKECGSINVELKVWQNQQTGKISDAGEESIYCNYCKRETEGEWIDTQTAILRSVRKDLIRMAVEDSLPVDMADINLESFSEARKEINRLTTE